MPALAKARKDDFFTAKVKRCFGICFLVATGFCIFHQVLFDRNDTIKIYEAVITLSLQPLVLACLAVWSVFCLLQSFKWNDLVLVIFLAIGTTTYFINRPERPTTDAATLLAGITLACGLKLLLGQRDMNVRVCGSLGIIGGESAVKFFLLVLIGALTFASWWHLDMLGPYHGPRWMGLWNNPNIYGMLMSAGLLLAIGLVVTGRVRTADVSGRMAFINRKPAWFLFIAVGMMGVGLLFSYSRGAWLGTAIGLLYLAAACKKLKWRFVLLGILVVSATVWIFWKTTPDTAPWYLKRLDFSRPSAQHRVAAWHGALQIMWDHPFGVGWNRTEEIYEENYSPPENGTGAIATNDYLMLGTQLGWPGLICFVIYVGLCFKNRHRIRQPSTHGTESRMRTSSSPVACHLSRQIACRAAALAMLVGFWFDGGLFTLATAAVFWVLLELGKAGLYNGSKS